jgi:hypothetical protein
MAPIIGSRRCRRSVPSSGPVRRQTGGKTDTCRSCGHGHPGRSGSSWDTMVLVSRVHRTSSVRVRRCSPPQPRAAAMDGRAGAGRAGGDQRRPGGADGYGEWIGSATMPAPTSTWPASRSAVGSTRAPGDRLIRESLVIGRRLGAGAVRPGASRHVVPAGCCPVPTRPAAATTWLDGGLYDAAAIYVRARGILIDRAVYRDLRRPAAGRSTAPAADRRRQRRRDRLVRRPACRRSVGQLGCAVAPKDNPPC